MAMADARLLGGARSAASGVRIWGVMLKVATKKERNSNTARLRVMDRPMVNDVESPTMVSRSWRRRRRSPSGEMNSRPMAYLLQLGSLVGHEPMKNLYPACTSVGMLIGWVFMFK